MRVTVGSRRPRWRCGQRNQTHIRLRSGGLAAVSEQTPAAEGERERGFTSLRKQRGHKMGKLLAPAAAAAGRKKGRREDGESLRPTTAQGEACRKESRSFTA